MIKFNYLSYQLTFIHLPLFSEWKLVKASRVDTSWYDNVFLQVGVRHFWYAVVSSRFSILPDKRHLVEVQPGYFCVLCVHFPFLFSLPSSFPVLFSLLSWRCSVDKYFLFNKSRKRNLSYPAGGSVSKEGIYPSYSPLEALFKVHPVADTMQSHSVRNGLCSSCLSPCWCSSFPSSKYLLAQEVWQKMFWGQ